MIQNFDVQGGPELGRENLPKLRSAIEKQMLDGFLVPHEDEYQNEYLPDCNKRLTWLSGFTGSAGGAVVLMEKAAIFVDGRYSLQVEAQVDGELFSYNRLENNGIAKWLAANLKKGQRIGFDPRLHSPANLESLRSAAETAGANLISLGTNPLDEAWTDRPPAPRTRAFPIPTDQSGESHNQKRERIAAKLKSKGADAALITSPASIAWLLNIRGSDVMCTPLTLSTVILYADERVDLFIHRDKVKADLRAHLGKDVSLRSEDNLEKALTDLSKKTVWVDPNVSSSYVVSTLEAAGAILFTAMDPVALPKAQKNSTEIAGTETAHLRDGAALAKFLHWLDTTGQSGEEDEISAAKALEGFRAENDALRDLSFESISGAGPNGAIVHYRVSKATNLKLEKNSLYLIDSGGQYLDGTTDVTRTIAIGTPSEDMRRHYTLVLKGHIALAKIRFPAGTSGHALDVLARMALWQQGLDYDHGTGHGVGVFLGVHEGPQRISKGANNIPLLPGMIVSNEPGYYKTDSYGIRIENLQYVHTARPIEGGERDMLGFTGLTYAPLDKRLIKTALLTQDEHDWVNEYHKDVWEKISPRVEGDVKEWLKSACEEI